MIASILRVIAVALALLLVGCSTDGGPATSNATPAETFEELVEAPDGYEFAQPSTEQVASMGNLASGTVAIRNVVLDGDVIGVLIALEATEFEEDSGRVFAEASGASFELSQDHEGYAFDVYRLQGGSSGWVAWKHPYTVAVFSVEGGDVLPLTRELFDRL